MFGHSCRAVRSSFLGPVTKQFSNIRKQANQSIGRSASNVIDVNADAKKAA